MTDELKKKGFRTRVNSFYRKGKNEPFKISRSKFNNFLDCKRCFYLDRVKGLKEPSMPGWALNIAVDELLKKEVELLPEKEKKLIKNILNGVLTDEMIHICPIEW